MKYFVLLVILFLPLSPAFGYEYYERYGEFNTITNDPTVCFIENNDTESDNYFYELTNQSINQWSQKLQEYTNNQDAWNIYLRTIPENSRT